MEVQVLSRAHTYKQIALGFSWGNFVYMYNVVVDLNRKGVGETLVSPWRKVWENRGFPRSSSPLPRTNISMYLLKRVEDFYDKYERRIAPLALVAGFIFDSLTLKRIDLLYENLVFLAYLVIAGGGIALINYFQENIPVKNFYIKLEKYLPLLIQFAFGGVFSAFFIFYNRSANLASSWPFILALLFIMLGNEFFKNYYRRMIFQVSIYFVAVFSFSIFFLPVVLKMMGPYIFLLSGAASLGFMYLFAQALFKVVPKRYQDNRINLRNAVLVIFVVINILYFTNLIPPIPLSMKEAGVYHSVERVGGDYLALEEEKHWYEKLAFWPEAVHWRPGTSLFVFSSIFAPTDLNTRVVHDWQYYNEVSGDWVSVTRVTYSISGGREGGYRGFSEKSNLSPGKWRVDVKTERGQIIGRVSFDLEVAEGEIRLEEKRF